MTSAVHDRMPMILDPGNYDVWLDPGMKNADALSDMLKPFDPDLMRSYPVSNRVNYAVNDDEDCSMPEKLVQKQSSLFS